MFIKINTIEGAELICNKNNIAFVVKSVVTTLKRPANCNLFLIENNVLNPFKIDIHEYDQISKILLNEEEK
jgi:hypothetical protein